MLRIRNVAAVAVAGLFLASVATAGWGFSVGVRSGDSCGTKRTYVQGGFSYGSHYGGHYVTREPVVYVDRGCDRTYRQARVYRTTSTRSRCYDRPRHVYRSSPRIVHRSTRVYHSPRRVYRTRSHCAPSRVYHAPRTHVYRSRSYVAPRRSHSYRHHDTRHHYRSHDRCGTRHYWRR